MQCLLHINKSNRKYKNNPNNLFIYFLVGPNIKSIYFLVGPNMILSNTYNIVHQQPNTFNKAKLGVTRGSYANRVCNGSVTLPKKKSPAAQLRPARRTRLRYASKVRAIGFIPPAIGFSQQFMHCPRSRKCGCGVQLYMRC